MQIIWYWKTPDRHIEGSSTRKNITRLYTKRKHQLPIWQQYSRQTWSSVISGWHKLQVKCVLLLQLPSKHQMLQTVHHQQDNVFKRTTQAIAPGQVITTIYYIAACIPQLVIALMYQVLCCYLTFQFCLKFGTIKQFSHTIKSGVHITVKPVTLTVYAQHRFSTKARCTVGTFAGTHRFARGYHDPGIHAHKQVLHI
jgi:hypothetical protein